MTRGSATVVSTLPEPPAFQNSRSVISASARAISSRRVSELGHRGGLEAAYDGRARALPRHVVGDAGHLALVGHHPDEAVAAAHDLAGEAGDLLDVVEGGALGADVLLRRPAAEAQPGVDVEGHPRRLVGRVGLLDQGEVGGVVDHQGDRAPGLAVAEQVAQGHPCRRSGSPSPRRR